MNEIGIRQAPYSSRAAIIAHYSLPSSPWRYLITELLMKTVTLLLLSLLLASCARHTNSAENRLSDTAKRQQAYADDLANEYVDCIDGINERTAVEKYAEKHTRRNAVMESCHQEATSFTIVQEQAYDNACRVSGKAMTTCESEAVSKAKRDTEKLLQEASQHIDRTSAAHRSYAE
jgi:hypothetical protein